MKQMIWHILVGSAGSVSTIVWLGYKPFACKYLLASFNLTSQDFPPIIMHITVSNKADA